MFELYSRRMKKQQQEQPEIYKYDWFPDEFRVQVYYIIRDYISVSNDFLSSMGNYFKTVYDLLLREMGVKSLTGKYPNDKDFECYIDTCTSVELLDLIDLAFNIIYKTTVCVYQRLQKQAQFSLTELNNRFLQHNIGYEFIGGKIVRKDNMLLHQEVVKPALLLLTNNIFTGAENEFLEAFNHRRKGENKESIQYALKAFESTMKTICDRLHYSSKGNSQRFNRCIRI